MSKSRTRMPITDNAQNIFGQPLSIFGLPVDRATIFSNEKKIHKAKIEKRQRRLIAKITFIKFFLQDGEVIQCVTTGYSPVRWMEQLLTGPAFLYFKRAMFVFTDRRLLHVPTSFNRSAHSAVSQVMYEDCASMAIKGRMLVIAYKNGRQETFPYLGRKEKKKIKALIGQLPIRPKEAGRLQGRVHLCPGCTRVLPRNTRQCRHCKLTFKTRRMAVLMALLVPGGGYLYSRHSVLALVTGGMEILMLAVVATHLGSDHTLTPYPNLPLPIVPVAIALLAMIKWITAFHSLELIGEFMPGPRQFDQRKI